MPFDQSAYLAARKYKYEQDNQPSPIGVAAASGLASGIDDTFKRVETNRQSALKTAIEEKQMVQKAQLEAVAKLIETHTFKDEAGNEIPKAQVVNALPQIMSAKGLPPGWKAEPIPMNYYAVDAEGNIGKPTPITKGSRVGQRPPETPEQAAARAAAIEKAKREAAGGPLSMDPKAVWTAYNTAVDNEKNAQILLNKVLAEDKNMQSAGFRQAQQAYMDRQKEVYKLKNDYPDILGGRNSSAQPVVNATVNTVAQPVVQPKYSVGQELDTPKGRVRIVGFKPNGVPLIEVVQ